MAVVLKLVHALGQYPTVAFDAGIILAKEVPYADFVVSVDGGIELRFPLASSLRLLVGGGAGVDVMAGEYLDGHARLSGGGKQPRLRRGPERMKLGTIAADGSSDSAAILDSCSTISSVR
jgi:hypothetical protein